jgi:hypothetical protein
MTTYEVLLMASSCALTAGEEELAARLLTLANEQKRKDLEC